MLAVISWGRTAHELTQSQVVSFCVDGSTVCVIDCDRTGMCRMQLCGWPWRLEDLQSGEDGLLLPYAWLYETLNDEHSRWQAYDGISLVTAAS